MLPKLPKLSNPFNQKTTRRRTPTLLQMEAVECGAAALGIIMSYYGRIIPLAQLRQDCGVSRDGSKAGNVLKAAKSYGMSGKGLKIQELDALKKIRTPYIVFWNFNHFLVVEGITKKQVFLNDPATGPRKVSIDEFDGSYTGVVLVLEPGEEFKRGGSKPSIFAALWNRLKGSLGVLLYCILAGFLLVIPGLAIPVFTQVFVQDVLIQNRYEWLRPLLGGIVITSFLNGFLTLLQLQFLRKMKIKLSVGMSSKFVWHILRLPVSFYAQRFAGEISSRVRLNDRLANLLSGQLATTAISVVMVIFYAAVMWQYNQALTIIGIAFVLFNLAVLQLVSRQRVDANMRLMQQEGKVNGVAISGLQSMETLKASGLESDFFARWSGYYANSINARQEMDLSNQTIGTIPSFLSYITTMLVLVVGGLQVMDGNMKIGALVAFQALMQRFLEPVNSLVSLGNDLQDMEGSITRLDDVLQNPVDPQTEAESPELEKKGKKKGNQVISYAATQNWDVNITKLQGYVELENITFGYNRVAAPLIENLSLSLKPGQRVALVGGSGSGKSTVAKLVSGLYEPWDGEIRFDGVKRSHIPRQVLVNSIAMVEQDVLLFGGTVRDNLTLWDSTVPDRYLMRACEDAAIHEVVQSIPSGYNGNLLEGATNLSGGQRQRLEIARTLVNNPSILVMDEATSALDTETEKIIDQKLRQRGCTCIIVAHRLSTIRDCDEIIVFEKGKVVQRGTHEELQRVEGHYLQLVKSEGGAL